jgi:cytochrome c oxidase subunit 2
MWFNFPVSPPQASNWAAEHDTIFWALTALTTFFSVTVGALAIYFALKYRQGNKVDRSRPVYEDLRMELAWTITPALLGLVMYFFGARLFVQMRTMPKDAENIFVIGKQWMWHVQHANGTRENNTLHVPVGKPIKLTMISQDVIHAFYIPAFRVQYHVVPGRYTHMWFTPTKEGEYHLFCGMYCGTQHSEMGGKVTVMSQAAYAEWLANGGEYGRSESMAQAGQRLYSKLACNNCHGAEDNLRAPSLANIIGRQRRLQTGETISADEGYLRESILRPWNRLTTGYGPTMPPYEGQISEEDVLSLVAYIKTIGAASLDVPQIPNPGSIRNEIAQTQQKPSVQVGADKFNEPRTDATPTNRTGSPAVGAIAAEDRNR